MSTTFTPESLGLTPENIETLAREAGFYERNSSKISPNSFLRALLTLAPATSPSFNDLAGNIETQTGIACTRQAIGKRCKAKALAFVQAVFELVFRNHFPPQVDLQPQFLGKYLRVIVADSTLVKLPTWLYAVFSGTANATTKSCHCRIQAVYDLISMTFLHFSIDPYTKNDLAAASDFAFLPGDLVLRDRGYLCAEQITKQEEAQVASINRHMQSLVYFDPKTNEPFDLLAHLLKHGSIDQTVRMKAKGDSETGEGTLVRLVGAEVPEEVANLRRMRARKETHGHNPSAKVLAMMSWSVYIVTKELWEFPFKVILAIYGLRWRIEIIFKAWKSHLCFDKVHRLSEVQLRILLFARLMLVLVIVGRLYGSCFRLLRRRRGRVLSLLKFARYLQLNPTEIHLFATYANGADPKKANSKDFARAEQILLRYCSYEKRKRFNFNDQWEAAGLS